MDFINTVLEHYAKSDFLQALMKQVSLRAEYGDPVLHRVQKHNYNTNDELQKATAYVSSAVSNLSSEENYGLWMCVEYDEFDEAELKDSVA